MVLHFKESLLLSFFVGKNKGNVRGTIGEKYGEVWLNVVKSRAIDMRFVVYRQT